MSAPVQPEALPAFIFCEPKTAGLKIAGLTVLDRLIVAVFRGGARKITLVSRSAVPTLKRSMALGISFNVVPEAPASDHLALVATTGVLVQASDVRSCIENRGRLAGAGGEKLPVGVAAPNGGPVMEMLETALVLTAGGVAVRVQDGASAKAAESALWRSMTSSSDGFVDRVFNRPCGRPLSRMLIHTSVSPNAVSVFSILIGVISAVFFALGDHWAAVLGAVLFQISAIVDCVDGDIARVAFKESPLGKWLDLAGDQVVHVSVFAGIAAGVVRAGESPELIWLGVSAIAGALISFAVVVRGMRRRTGENSVLQRLIDSATNRDFSVVVLALALLGQLDWFLWMAAVGSHVFWITALALQLRMRPARGLAS